MSDEITHNCASGLTLYFCCFQQDGDVFLTGGASDEVWGTGGRTAADYDEAMTEEAGSGHYKGSIAAGVGAGVYQIVVYLQVGAGPADADPPVSQGEIYWDGSAEINPSTLDALIDTADTVVDAIKAVTDNLPNSGALTDIDTGVNNIEAKLPSNYIMGSAVQTDKDDDIDAILVDTGTTLPAAITAAHATTDAAIATAQADLDIITGVDGTTLSTASVTAMWNKAMSDLSAGAPSATASVLTAINYLYEYMRNKVVTDSANNELVVYKDDGTTKLMESDISDDGALFTKGEMRAPD